MMRVLPDGSCALVEPSGSGVVVSRVLPDGRCVWGQAFRFSPYDALGKPDEGRQDREVAEVVKRMTADPQAFHRWWLQ